jgi:Na+-driven multidrug efflux pump
MMIVLAVMSPIRAFNFNNIVGVLRGGGDVKASFFIDVSFMYLLALPLAAFTGLFLKLSVIWIYLAIGLDDLCRFVFGLMRFVVL